MKKTIFVISIVIIIFVAVFGSLFIIDHNRMNNNQPVVFSTWGRRYAPPESISPKEATEIVRATLGKYDLETITNLDNPKIEEVIFDTPPQIAYFDNETDITGKTIYKITYNTTVDGLLGPVVTYVDKTSGKIIGADFRE